MHNFIFIIFSVFTYNILCKFSFSIILCKINSSDFICFCFRTLFLCNTLFKVSKKNIQTQCSSFKALVKRFSWSVLKRVTDGLHVFNAAFNIVSTALRVLRMACPMCALHQSEKILNAKKANSALQHHLQADCCLLSLSVREPIRVTLQFHNLTGQCSANAFRQNFRWEKVEKDDKKSLNLPFLSYKNKSQGCISLVGETPARELNYQVIKPLTFYYFYFLLFFP